MASQPPPHKPLFNPPVTSHVSSNPEEERESDPMEVITNQPRTEEAQMEQLNEKGDSIKKSLDIQGVKSSMKDPIAPHDESDDKTAAGDDLVSIEEQDKAGGQPSSTSQLASMLDQIISDMKTNTKKNTDSPASTNTDQVLAIKSIPITQATNSSPTKGQKTPKSPIPSSKTTPAKTRSSPSCCNLQKVHKSAKLLSKAPKKTPNQSQISRQLGRRKAGGQMKRKGEETKAALISLQESRTDCTWVMCSREECSKWRYLAVKDPSLVEDDWECKDNPDQRFGECGAPEQWWDKGMREKFVENRFTVGSLVMARLEGWPAWPAMVDDDPDTGDFFWTGVRGGEWEDRPSQYHVVFFDGREKGVSRAWVLDRRLERMVEGEENSSSKRLCQAMEMARQAGREDLKTRRRNYCLAARFKGPWGDVWPGLGEEEEEIEDESKDENEDFLKLNIEIRKSKPRKTNVTSANQAPVTSVRSLSARNVGAVKRASAVSSGDDEEGNNPAVKVSRTGSQSGDEESPSTVATIPEIASSTAEENSLPDSTMQLVDSLNPIQDNLVVTTTSHPGKQVTPSLQSLLPPPSPVASHSLTPYQTSTPVRKSAISSPSPTTPLPAHNLSHPSPTTHPLLPTTDQSAALNTTSGSTAFSADGSFMEL